MICRISSYVNWIGLKQNLYAIIYLFFPYKIKKKYILVIWKRELYESYEMELQIM